MPEIGRTFLTCLMLGVLLPDAPAGEPVRIMPLGDSITHGYGSGITVMNSYRKVLKALLEDNGYSVDFVGGLADGDFPDNQHHGHDGWYADHDTSTNTILSRAAAWVSATSADIVLLHIGTNDIHGHHEDAAEVDDILDEIYGANSNATVVLALIINAADGYSRSGDISAYNSNLNVMAQGRIAGGDDLLVVDMENGAGMDYGSADMAGTLHPSQAGYDKMATNWYPAVEAAVERQFEKGRPRIILFELSMDSASFSLANLSASSTLIQRASVLEDPGWNNLTGFVPSAETTNITVSCAISSNGYFRLSVP